MRNLPSSMAHVLAPLAPLFFECVRWHLGCCSWASSPPRGGGPSARACVSLDREKRFHRYHWVLSRANRSSLGTSRVLHYLAREEEMPSEDLPKFDFPPKRFPSSC